MKEQIAKILLDLKCVQLRPKDPFTYASGLKGPIYCDNRLLMSHVDHRKIIIDEFVKLLSNENVDVIAGMATAGIAHAAWIAERLQLPMAYIRSKPKGHGRQNQIEGKIESGQNVVLIEDLVNQGSSIKTGIEVVKEVAHVEKVYSIMTYQMPAAIEVFSTHGVQLVSLTDFETLIHVAHQESLLSEEELGLLKKWQQDPKNWSSV